MALTREFKETVMARAAEDPDFREGLLTEAIECFCAGELDTGKILLRDYVNATIGFQELAHLMGKTDTSLMRMLSPKGNPTAENLFGVIAELQNLEGISLVVTAEEGVRKAG